MSNTKDNPYAHSSLLGAPNGLTFAELKKNCNFTDGNLSRHLNTLEKANAVTIKKRFVRKRPQTMVALSKRGRKDFLTYLQALEAVLLDAASKAGSQQTQPGFNTSILGIQLTKA